MIKDSTNIKDLTRLKGSLEKHLGWGAVSGWHSSMFNELSEKIFANCQVMLSPATLKRFFGVVSHDGLPSTSTLDALSQFIGYNNWRDFKQDSPKKGRSFGSNVPKKTLYVTAGFLIALITIVLIGSKRPEDPEILETITFSSRSVTNSYPNSVIFDFDLKSIRTDSIHIQQYWDATKTIDIDKDQNQATGIYYFPGYFRAKLIVDGQMVKEHDLFLRSNGWMGTIEYKPVPKYFVPQLTPETILTYPEELTKEIETSSDPLVSVYHYINDLGNVSADNFTLNTSIRTTFNERWAVCQASIIYIIGTKGAFMIPFSKIGCSSDNNLMLNDVYLNGKEHDLSAFGTDLSEFTDIQLNVRDQNVIISIKGSEVFQAKYESTMGRLVGLRFKFIGLGEVEYFELLDQRGGEVELK